MSKRGEPDPGVTPQGRMTDAVHAEWTEQRTIAGPAWLLLGAITLTVPLGAIVAGRRHLRLRGFGPVATAMVPGGLVLRLRDA